MAYANFVGEKVEKALPAGVLGMEAVVVVRGAGYVVLETWSWEGGEVLNTAGSSLEDTGKV